MGEDAEWSTAVRLTHIGLPSQPALDSLLHTLHTYVPELDATAQDADHFGRQVSARVGQLTAEYDEALVEAKRLATEVTRGMEGCFPDPGDALLCRGGGGGSDGDGGGGSGGDGDGGGGGGNGGGSGGGDAGQVRWRGDRSSVAEDGHGAEGVVSLLRAGAPCSRGGRRLFSGICR